MSIMAIEWKMMTVHIINAVQAFSLVVTGVLVAWKLVQCALMGDSALFWSELVNANPHGLMAMVFGTATVEGSSWIALFITFGCLPPMGMLTTGTMFMVVKDLMEGKYYARDTASMDSCSKEADAKALRDAGNDTVKIEEYAPLTRRERFKLMNTISFDMWALAEPTVVVFSLIPELMAAWSLMFNGHRFEYIVAAKPTD